jgi:RNA polymerase sigma-70 factor (ECF subfamily)
MVCTIEDLLMPESARAMVRVVSLETGSATFDDDVAQEALLRTLMAVRRVGSVEHPYGFFMKIVRDTLYSHWRRRRILLDLESLGEDRLSDGPSFDEDIDRRRRLERIYEAMDSLGAGQRELFELYYFQEYSIAEMAALIGKSPSAIKMGLLRGRDRILQVLADYASPND